MDGEVVSVCEVNDGKAISGNSLAIFDEAKAFTATHQCDLVATLEEQDVVLRGAFIVTGPSGPFDHFSIEARFSPDFPNDEPKIFEIGGRIPKLADRHVYESSGRCCICVWEEWLVRNRIRTLEGFMRGPANDYFVSQRHFELHNSWPYGERSHGEIGVFEAACELLNIEPNADVALNIRACIGLLVFVQAGKPLKGHNPCPCGNGMKFRDCHRDKLNAIAENLTPDLAMRLLGRMTPKET